MGAIAVVEQVGAHQLHHLRAATSVAPHVDDERIGVRHEVHGGGGRFAGFPAAEVEAPDVHVADVARQPARRVESVVGAMSQLAEALLLGLRRRALVVERRDHRFAIAHAKVPVLADLAHQHAQRVGIGLGAGDAVEVAALLPHAELLVHVVGDLREHVAIVKSLDQRIEHRAPRLRVDRHVLLIERRRR